VPLAVVLPDASANLSSPDFDSRRIPQLVLCGDHMQLGPAISSHVARSHELDLPLLQRLFERELYENHEKARHSLNRDKTAEDFRLKLAEAMRLAQEIQEQDDSPNTSAADVVQVPRSLPSYAQLAETSTPFANLINNYRSHVGLLMVPSALFYNDTLEPKAKAEVQNTPLIRWESLKDTQVPLLIAHTAGQEEMFEEGASWYNFEEIEKVVAVVQELVGSKASSVPKHGQVLPSEISIIAPFREQVSRPQYLALERAF